MFRARQCRAHDHKTLCQSAGEKASRIFWCSMNKEQRQGGRGQARCTACPGGSCPDQARTGADWPCLGLSGSDWGRLFCLSVFHEGRNTPRERRNARGSGPAGLAGRTGRTGRTDGLGRAGQGTRRRVGLNVLPACADRLCADRLWQTVPADDRGGVPGACSP